MTVSTEQLCAYVDGQCDAAEAQRIEQTAAADKELARRIAQERALRERLRSHFAPVAEEPIPDAWEALIRGAVGAAAPEGGAAVIDLSEARARRADPRGAGRGWLPRVWLGSGIAASLVLGLLLGLFVGPQLRDAPPIAAHDGVLTAQGKLADALDTQLASAQDNAPVRMLLTFRSTDGAICRAFSGAEASGIACRSGDAWQLRHVLPGRPRAAAEYRQAGSENGELAAIAQGMSAGDAFDRAKEMAARDHGWR